MDECYCVFIINHNGVPILSKELPQIKDVISALYVNGLSIYFLIYFMNRIFYLYLLNCQEITDESVIRNYKSLRETVRFARAEKQGAAERSH